MRVLVAGASGALGVPLTRLLSARGHSVVGLIRNPAGADGVRAVRGTARIHVRNGPKE